MRPRSPSVTLGLEKLYRKLLGERDRILCPPKRARRLDADRVAYDAGAEQRVIRLTEIEEALPHVAYVIKLYQPDWRESDVKPIRPKADWSNLPPNGWTAAAVDVLREAKSPLTIAEIVVMVGDRYDLDLSTVQLRQKAHTSVNNGLKRSFGHVVTRHGGRPERFTIGL